MINPYPQTIENNMQTHYSSLNEKDKRSYAAIEALKLGLGGKKYIVKLFKCSPNRIARGISELQGERASGVRLPGGGRKRALKKTPELLEAFDKVTEGYTAGSPVDENIKRTNLRPQEIVDKMRETEKIETSVYIVNQIIAHKGWRKRKLHKGKTLKSVVGRNEQFENIKNIKETAEKKGNPIVSVDTKKKNFCENLPESESIIAMEE